MISPRLSITRIVNACTLIVIEDEAVLTDPYFVEHWFMRMREPIGMKVANLPRLAAIIGGHGVYDHWQPRSLEGYPFKETTPVFVASRSMCEKAKAAGFGNVEVVDWNESRRISDKLTLEVVPAQKMLGHKPNSYVLNGSGLRVFIGTEARDIEPLREYRRGRPAVDVALLPIDGSAIAGLKLVMRSSDAVEAANVLGAKILIPIHYAMKPVPILLQTPGSTADLLHLGAPPADLEIVPLETGRLWEWPNGVASDRARANLGLDATSDSG